LQREAADHRALGRRIAGRELVDQLRHRGGIEIADNEKHYTTRRSYATLCEQGWRRTLLTVIVDVGIVGIVASSKHSNVLVGLPCSMYTLAILTQFCVSDGTMSTDA